MSTMIKNGKGNGDLAEVDSLGRLHTKATTETAFESAIVKGAGYTIATGVVNLTNDVEAGVFYFTSNEDSDVVIDNIIISVGGSDVTGDIIRTDVIAPSGGTLISGGTALPIINMRASNQRAFAGTALVGGTGFTVTGGFGAADIRHQSQSSQDRSGLIIPKGTSLAMKMQPPSGNSSLNVFVSLRIYLLDEV